MAISAEQFLDLLEARKLLTAAQLDSLRRQARAARPPVAADAIASLLVEKGVLTEARARELLTPAHKTASLAAAVIHADDDLAPLEAIDDFEPLGDAVLPLDEGLEPLGDDALAPLGAAEYGDFPLAGAVDLGAQAATAVALAPTKGATTPTQVPRQKGVLGPVLGGLALLVLVGGGVTWLLLPPGNGEAAFAPAVADYQAGQYALAAEKCAGFLAEYPHSNLAGEARVHLAAARLLDARARRTQPRELLARAVELLPAIAGEAAIAKVQGDLAPLLVELADSLAQSAVEASGDTASVRVADARQAMALADDGRLLPAALRPWQRLAAIDESLAAAEHRFARDARVAGSLESMQAAVAAGKFAEALAARRALVAGNPDLADDVRLRDFGLRLAAAAAERVETIERKIDAETTARAAGVARSVSFASRVADASKSKQPLVVATPDALWSLDAATGGVLWRRAASGYPAAAWCTLRKGESGNIAVFDARAQELSVLAATSGALAWRAAIDAPLAGAPVAVGDRVIVATRAGHVIALDATTGVVRAAVRLPIPLRAGPTITRDGKSLVIPADELLVLLLEADSLAASGTLYTGHEAGTLTQPPAPLERHAVVIADRGIRGARLSLVPLTGEKSGGRSGVPRIDLLSRVVAPPVVLGRRVCVITDDGVLQSFEVTDDAARPLNKQSELPVAAAKESMSYLMPAGTSLWVAGRGVARLQPKGGGEWESSGEFSIGEGAVLAPPQAVGKALLLLHAAANGSETIATLVGSGGKPLWQTMLGQSPTAAEAAVHSMPLQSATSSQVLESQAQTETPPSTSSPSAMLPGDLACPSVDWAGGVLAVCRDGSVWLLDASSGAPRAAPLQLPLDLGQSLANCRLAATSEGNSAAFACLDDGRLFALEVKADPLPHVAIRAAGRVAAMPVGELAQIGQSLLVADTAGTVHLVATDTLVEQKSVSLGGSSIAWGPQAIGERVVLALATGELVALDAAAEVAWRMQMESPPIGNAAVDGERLILASPGGKIVVVDRSSGQIVAQIDTGDQLASGPVVVGQAVCVVARDGTVLQCRLTAGDAAP